MTTSVSTITVIGIEVRGNESKLSPDDDDDDGDDDDDDNNNDDDSTCLYLID